MATGSRNKRARTSPEAGTVPPSLSRAATLTTADISRIPLEACHTLLLEHATSYPSLIPRIASFIPPSTPKQPATRSPIYTSPSPPDSPGPVDFSTVADDFISACSRSSDGGQAEMARQLAEQLNCQLDEMLVSIMAEPLLATGISAFVALSRIAAHMVLPEAKGMMEEFRSAETPWSLADTMERILDVIVRLGSLKMLKRQEGLEKRMRRMNAAWEDDWNNGGFGLMALRLENEQVIDKNYEEWW